MGVRILPAPESNGSRGPLPRQLDWLDHRLRKTSGNVSETIPFARPGWCSAQDWEAFRKGVERETQYELVRVRTVRPTLGSLTEYIRHLNAERKSLALIAAKRPPEPPEPREDIVLIRGCTDLQLRQYDDFRRRGWRPWVWTKTQGTNIVLINHCRRAFIAWQKSRKGPSCSA